MHLAPEFKTYQDAIRQIAKGDIYSNTLARGL